WRLNDAVSTRKLRGEVPRAAAAAVALVGSAGRGVVADAGARRGAGRPPRVAAEGGHQADASPVSPRHPPVPRYRGVRDNRKTLKSGPVTGAGELAIPIGGGGGTAVIGRMIEPPSYVPPATGVPNRSCTLHTAYRSPT